VLSLSFYVALEAWKNDNVTHYHFIVEIMFIVLLLSIMTNNNNMVLQEHKNTM
jgi:hypothetical protein